MERRTGAYELWAPHQGIPEVRRDLAVAMDVPATEVLVHPVDVGGGFGARGPAYPEYAAVLLAARRVGQPVRWIGTRLEGFLGEHHGRGTRLSGRLAIDAAGRFLSLSVTLEGDLGAWVTPVGAHIHVHNPLQTLTGVYRIPVAAFAPTLHVTNTVPTGPYRGAGRPDIALLVERLVDEAARSTGLDRIALRRRNAIPKARFPFRTAAGRPMTAAITPASSIALLPNPTGKASRAAAGSAPAPDACAASDSACSRRSPAAGRSRPTRSS